MCRFTAPPAVRTMTSHHRVAGQASKHVRTDR